MASSFCIIIGKLFVRFRKSQYFNILLLPYPVRYKYSIHLCQSTRKNEASLGFLVSFLFDCIQVLTLKQAVVNFLHELIRTLVLIFGLNFDFICIILINITRGGLQFVNLIYSEELQRAGIINTADMEWIRCQCLHHVSG